MADIIFVDLSERLNIYLSKKKKESLIVLKTLDLQTEDLKRIKQHLNSKLPGLKQIKCYLSIPLGMLGFRIIELPFKDEKKILDVLPYELKERVLEDEDLVFDYVKLSGEEDMQKILAVYIKRSLLSQLLKDLSESGLEPDVITSFHLRYLLDHSFKAEDLLNPPDYKQDILNILRKESSSPVINLKKGTFGLTLEKEKLIRRLKTTNIWLIAILLILSALFSVSIVKTRKGIATIKDHIQSGFRQEFPQEKIKDEVLQLKSHVRELREKKDILTGIPVGDILKRIKPPEGVMVESIEIDQKDISIKGEAQDLSKIDTFKERLKDIGKDPAITETGQFSGKIRFTIKVNR